MKKNIIPTAIILSMFVCGCAPSVNLTVQRPPVLNTSGIKRIAVMPFESERRVNSQLAADATRIATQRVAGTGQFTLVDAATVADLRRNGQNFEHIADAIFQGKITRAESQNETQSGSYRTRDGETVDYTDHITIATVELEYSIVRARDGSLVGPVFRTQSRQMSNRENFPPAAPLMQQALSAALGDISRNIAPYTVTENRTLAKDRTGNKALNAEMKNAASIVRAGNYRQALALYLDIYERYKSVAAAENAAILHEAFGDVAVAAEFMRRVFDETGNPRAQDIIVRHARILRDQATIAANYAADAPRTATDRASAHAAREIQKVLGTNALVWIYNNSPNNALVDAVFDNVTAEFLRNGVRVVDRQNAALIAAEHELQMSGMVSDEEIVRIGNVAGANVIVLLGLSGSGAMRRLQVRVLDIERGVPILQSDTGHEWQL